MGGADHSARFGAGDQSARVGGGDDHSTREGGGDDHSLAPRDGGGPAPLPPWDAMRRAGWGRKLEREGLSVRKLSLASSDLKFIKIC